MLDVLFGSELRVKILSLVLLRPETKYSSAQVARDLKLPINSVRRELDLLLKFGLLIAAPAPINELIEIKTNKLKIKKIAKVETPNEYFEVNKNFILYPEIKALFVKAQILSSQKFISNLQKNFQPKLLVLTGFFTNFPEAHTDILIVGRVKRPAFLKLMAELEKDLGHEINFTILDEKEFRYRQEIMDIFLYNILEGKKITLIDNLNLN